MREKYISLMSEKRIVFGSRFNDGRIRVFFENASIIKEPLYIIREFSSKAVFQLSAFGIKIFNYPKKDMLIVNKWPDEIFMKV
jgi:hypothetical protein